MKRIFDLSELDWKVAGFIPHEWRMYEEIIETHKDSRAEIPAIKASVPGSAQKALFDAGLLPDWNTGLNARACEWVENRHWVYEVEIPAKWFSKGREFRLRCLGLDYCGSIRLNGREIYQFCNSFVPHEVDITPYVVKSGNVLQIIFECPPRALGQFNFTSKIKQMKPRFNYYWDWVCRLVQIGIWDKIFIDAVNSPEIKNLKITSDFNLKKKSGQLKISGKIEGDKGCCVHVKLTRGKNTIRSENILLSDFNKKGVAWADLEVKPWWPNGMGHQILYNLVIKLLDESGKNVDTVKRKIGFKKVIWQKCAGAPRGADPWICVINGQKIFLQGINWAPIRPNFADVTETDYRKRLKLYRDLGFNLIRVWGGGFLEKECFYRMCDDLGLMVWQDFPLSASGVENRPPRDQKTIEKFCEVAKSYIYRRQHHVCLIIWCGGNELRKEKYWSNGNTPVGWGHPLIKALHKIARKMDPARRFLPSSVSGPRFFAKQSDFGKGLHWAVDGPWKAEGTLAENWVPYWEGDDSMFRTEVGAPSPSPVSTINRYKGQHGEMPCDNGNPLWRRSPWWTEWHIFIKEKGRKPKDIQEYVKWGQKRQSNALQIVVESCRKRFPRCGGVIIWLGHDSFPCTANTAIVDFDGNPKPAAIVLSQIFEKYAPKRKLYG